MEVKMTKKCNNCTKVEYENKDINVVVPYIVHEATVARQERQIKRLWVAIIVLIGAIFLMNAAWIEAWTSYDYSSEEIIVDAEDNGNANYIGQDGNIYNGEDNSAETQED
jgi:hypothetical protein